MPALYAATAGYDVIEEVGVDAIRERSLDLTDHLIGLADAAGFEVTSQRDQARRGASVTIRVPGFEGVHKELSERQILCDFRPDVGLRLGPHFFNNERARVRRRPDRGDPRLRRPRATPGRSRAFLVSRRRDKVGMSSYPHTQAAAYGPNVLCLDLIVGVIAAPRTTTSDVHT